MDEAHIWCCGRRMSLREWERHVWSGECSNPTPDPGRNAASDA